MDAIALQYKRIRRKYPDAPELEIWHGVAMDFYLRQGTIPTEVLVQSALARAEGYGTKYRPDQLRVPAGNPDGGQWTDEGGDGGGDGETTVDPAPRARAPAEARPTSIPSTQEPNATGETTPRFLDENIDTDPKPFDGAEITPAAGEGGNYGIKLLDDEEKMEATRYQSMYMKMIKPF